MMLPDSELCQAAVSYAKQVSQPYLFHHVMRSAVYAEHIGQQQKMQYDREVVFVATVLHDLGLTDIVPVQIRFEVEGADAAKAYLSTKGLTSKGLTEKQLDLVWDAIALHTTNDIPQRKSPETALCQLGIASDLSIISPALINEAFIDEVLHAYPWLNAGEALMTTLENLYHKNPASAASNAVADVCEHRVPGFQKFNLCRHLTKINHS